MPATASISTNISQELFTMFTTIAKAEKRSKSYYVQKGLETFLRQRIEDLEDYQDTKQAYDEFVASGEVFQGIK